MAAPINAAEKTLHQLIANHQGAISFARFMEFALYHPQFGYYTSGCPIGKRGDFITAPELSSLFSRCLARQCAEILELLGGGAIVEYGAGTGQMALDIADELVQLGVKPTAYYIVEISPALTKQQQSILQGKTAVPFFWITTPPKNFRGVIIANEFLDALPIHRLIWEKMRFLSLCVTTQKEGFNYCQQQPTSEALAQKIASITKSHHDNFVSGYTSEVNLVMDDWLLDVAKYLDSGAALIIDYGMTAHEYYHPNRISGSLVCHYQHQRHHDPLIHIGQQDITAAVDFSALARGAEELGLTVHGYATQAHFLINCDLLAQAEKELSTIDRARQAQQIAHLILPGEMGEHCKVLALSRGVDQALQGFRQFDQCHRL